MSNHKHVILSYIAKYTLPLSFSSYRFMFYVHIILFGCVTLYITRISGSSFVACRKHLELENEKIKRQFEKVGQLIFKLFFPKITLKSARRTV